MLASNIFAVMAGGAIGALLRYSLVNWVVVHFGVRDIPLGTLFVNVLGSFVIGILAYLFLMKINNDFLRIFFIIGFLGSFTTVSSFSLETVELIMQAQYLRAVLNIAATILLCLAATWLGLFFAKTLFN